MSWYAAHVVMYVKLKDVPQERYPYWENIILIQADSGDEAYEKAERRGREDVFPDDSFRWGGKPAEWVFAGVRKVTLCVDPEERPGDGTEVTYLEMEAASWDDLMKLMRGEPAVVEVDDTFPDDDEPEDDPAACHNSTGPPTIQV